MVEGSEGPSFMGGEGCGIPVCSKDYTGTRRFLGGAVAGERENGGRRTA